MARQRIEITEKQREQVQTLAANHLNDDVIAVVVGIKEATMQRRCRKELDLGRALGKVQLAETGMQLATSGKCPAMTIFMHKVRLGCRETGEVKPPTPPVKERITAEILPASEKDFDS